MVYQHLPCNILDRLLAAADVAAHGLVGPQRLIDEEIAPRFDATLVAEQREKAKHRPHPFWRDLSMARMAI